MFNSDCWFTSDADVVLMSVRLEFTLLRPASRNDLLKLYTNSCRPN